MSKPSKEAKDALARGDKFYVPASGKPCRTGHVGLRRSDNGACIACERLSKKVYRDAHIKPKRQQAVSIFKRMTERQRERFAKWILKRSPEWSHSIVVDRWVSDSLTDPE